MSTHNQAALGVVSLGGATVAWIPFIDMAFRWGAAIAAILSGVAGFIYYGRQNGWWK